MGVETIGFVSIVVFLRVALLANHWFCKDLGVGDGRERTAAHNANMMQSGQRSLGLPQYGSGKQLV